jgi:nucleoside-diphosphate-sugar epimerase
LIDQFKLRTHVCRLHAASSAASEDPELMTLRAAHPHDAAAPQRRTVASNSHNACHSEKKRVLVTGADGFVGRHLVPYLARQGNIVIAASRAAYIFENPNVVSLSLPDLSNLFDWQPLLEQCDTVVHLAGIAHRYASVDAYDRINHRATSALARAISRSGTKHLVFISSIAAQSGSCADHELTEDDFPTPNNPYGRSKFAAEQAVRAAGISFTILRPVVIYGEGEKGNFAAVHRHARLPIPLPFGSLTAQRSVLSIYNFNSAVEIALSSPRAMRETFIVSDPKPVTVADLITRHRVSMGRSPWLIPVPENWIKAALKATGQIAVWERIGQPLVAPPTKLLAIGWKPS